MRCLVISVVLCITWSAQIHLRGSRKLDDSDGGFNEGAELHPDHFIEQERSLDELEKIESLIHSDKVAKLMKKAKTEVNAYSKDYAQETTLDRLEKIIEGELGSKEESSEDTESLSQLNTLIRDGIQAKKNDALATTAGSSEKPTMEEENEASLDNLESLLNKEQTRIRRKKESFSGSFSHTDVEQALFNGKGKANIVAPTEELDSEKATVEEEDSNGDKLPIPETERDNIDLNTHAEENQYKWLKKKLGKKSRNKVLNGDEDNESFDTKLDEAGSIDRMEEMQSGSFDRSEWRSRMSKRNT